MINKYQRTAQLIYGKIDNCAISATGVLENSSSNDMLLAQIESGKTYSLSTAAYVGFFQTEPSKGSTSYDNTRTLVTDTLIAPITGYIAIRASHSTSNVMFNEGSTLLPYQPYKDFATIGYKKYETATDTITSLPQTIIGDGQNISAYTIKGNMTQSGTPTPSNPVYPTEVGEKTANLFNPNNRTTNSKLINGEVVTGTSLQGYYVSDYIAINGSNASINNARSYGWYDINKSLISYENKSYGIFRNYAKPNGATYIRLEFNASEIMSDAVYVLDGNYTEQTMPPFEPFGYKIPILSNGTTYPIYLSEPIRKIGDYVDTAPSTGTATRNIYKLVMTGQEAGWNRASSSGRYIYYLDTITPDYLRSDDITLLCSHYKAIAGVTGVSSVGEGETALFKSISTNQRLYFGDNNYSTAADFKQYLATQYANGTPVIVYYVTDTPTTESFTAPSIPTSGTAQSFDVDTTLAPSEVSLTYHGWHEHSDTKFTT